MQALFYACIARAGILTTDFQLNTKIVATQRCPVSDIFVRERTERSRRLRALLKHAKLIDKTKYSHPILRNHWFRRVVVVSRFIPGILVRAFVCNLATQV